MWIKICANTNLLDAQAAAELGADALGFVFAPSKRQVTADEVARITPHLPASVERVGVFTSQSADEISEIAERASLTAVQLHGGVNAALSAELNTRFSGRIGIIQTVHWNVDQDESSGEAVGRAIREINSSGIVNRVLIDSRTGAASGGTGVTFDWDAAAPALASAAGSLKLIVAGGLRPENVGEAVVRMHPWGVDVASGVEALPGRKDPEKLASFIRNARRAERASDPGSATAD
jgi:phosphoribosylanthranilate isomerase